MNIIKIFRQIYMELFSFAFDSEFDMDRAFNDLLEFHTRALPDSENQAEAMYAKVFKSKLYFLLSPLVYTYFKYLAMKYTNSEYLESLVRKSIDAEE